MNEKVDQGEMCDMYDNGLISGMHKSTLKTGQINRNVAKRSETSKS
jgi:hypothetical protein